jgi:amino acid transporter/mannitol/fructose-specific phosphotransferase system IIA component (Ntr-type)
MPTHSEPRRLKRELSLLDVYAIATGTTLSAGFFLLPSLAAAQAGPAVILSYAIAGLLLVPAMLSIVELATAMPKAGGAYYFLDRSLGPLFGAIGGLGTWIALMLKAAFALVGMGAYLALFLPRGESLPYHAIAAGLAIFFGAVNIAGSKGSGRFQVLLVAGLLCVLAWFTVGGSLKMEPAHFEGFFASGTGAVLSTAGLVFISYVGVTNVASVSEEVKDPEKNLPRGVFLALGSAMLVYVIGLVVMVGVAGVERLSGDPARVGQLGLTPVATVAELISGPGSRVGVIVVSIAALMAFSSVANAGILSASRYPLAMKLASTFQLLMFALLCLAVIVMRESRIDSYDPGFRSPFYPWLHIAGLLAPCALIIQMGWLPTAFSTGLIAIAVCWYFAYASRRVRRHGAIYHVFERLGQRRFSPLDTELRGILKEKGLREHDPFDEIVAGAKVIDAAADDTFDTIAERASELLTQDLACSAESLKDGFLQGTKMGATPVSAGIALPHLRLSEITAPRTVLVRAFHGIAMDVGDALGETHTEGRVQALFFVVSPEADPAQHLRILAKLAERAEDDVFMDQWLAARGGHRLNEILLRDERHIALRLEKGEDGSRLIGRMLRDIRLPGACSIAAVWRSDDALDLDAPVALHAGDFILIVGDVEGIIRTREALAAEPLPEDRPA